MPRASRDFFGVPPQVLARELIGQRLVRTLDGVRLAGIIVETEAYLGVVDKAAHTYGGRRTARNESMYAQPGTSYVYFTYGMHHCMNVVCGRIDEPVAVLIRALEPVEGLDEMRRHRGARRRSDKRLRDTDLCSGPAKTCQALALSRDQDGLDLVRSKTLFIERIRSSPAREESLVCTPRVGVAYAEEWASRPLRWMLAGSPHVSTGDANSQPASRRGPS